MAETICRDCVFRVDDQNGVQISCQLGRLQKFKEREQAYLDYKYVFTEWGEEYDTKFKNYYRIRRFCTTCRNQDWGKENEGKDLLSIVESEARPTFSLYLYVDNNTSLPDIEVSLSSSDKPDYVEIVINDDYNSDRAKQIKKLLAKYLPKVRFGFRHITDRDEFDNLPTKWVAIDLAITVCKEHYYTVLDSGSKLPENYFHKLHNAIYNDLEELVLVHGEGFFTCSIHLHKMVDGNKGKTVLQKAEEMFPNQDKYIKNFQELMNV